MLGHVGINVPDPGAAKHYYGAIMPLVGFEMYIDADDQFAYRPMAGKPGTYLFFYPSAESRGTRDTAPAFNTWHSKPKKTAPIRRSRRIKTPHSVHP